MAPIAAKWIPAFAGMTDHAPTSRTRVPIPIYYTLLALFVGAVLTFGAWYVSFRAERELIQRQTANRASNIEAAIEDRLDAYVAVLQVGAGLFDASDRVTYDDWTAFTQRLRQSPIYPGVQGVGFDAQHGQLFQVFGRLHRADEFEGTGIGLTIVKSVIERHRGRVWAESTPGQGATFWFVLPQPVRRAA